MYASQILLISWFLIVAGVEEIIDLLCVPPLASVASSSCDLLDSVRRITYFIQNQFLRYRQFCLYEDNGDFAMIFSLASSTLQPQSSTQQNQTSREIEYEAEGW